MAQVNVAAPPHPSQGFTEAEAQELRTLRGKGQRNLADSNRLIDLLVERVDALEAEMRLRS